MDKPTFRPDWKKVWSYLTNPKSDWKPKVAVLFALAYLVMPFDVIFDGIPILGWLDDVGILAVVAVYVLHKTSNQLPPES